MKVRDEQGLLKRLAPGSDAVLELGCGKKKKLPGSIGVDLIPSEAADVVGDALDVLRAIPEGSVRTVFSSHFLEHVEDLRSLLHEIVRVLRPGGEIVAIVPHFSNPYFYSDPTHRQFFGLYTFSYFVRDDPFTRRVRRYEDALPLRLREARLRLKSTKRHRVRWLLKKVLGVLVNLSTWTQEFYEENLCFLVPCYDVRFVLEREGDLSADELG